MTLWDLAFNQATGEAWGTALAPTNCPPRRWDEVAGPQLPSVIGCLETSTSSAQCLFSLLFLAVEEKDCSEQENRGDVAVE